jgi:hypothetical protein
MAGHDPAQFDRLMDWPLRDLFLAYIARLREAARDSYEVDLLVWAILAPHQKRVPRAPDLPAILK